MNPIINYVKIDRLLLRNEMQTNLDDLICNKIMRKSKTGRKLRLYSRTPARTTEIFGIEYTATAIPMAPIL